MKLFKSLTLLTVLSLASTPVFLTAATKHSKAEQALSETTRVIKTVGYAGLTGLAAFTTAYCAYYASRDLYEGFTHGNQHNVANGTGKIFLAYMLFQIASEFALKTKKAAQEKN